MELKFTIDTDDLYERDIDFEGLLRDTMASELIKSAKSNVASEQFKKFASLASNTIVTDIKLRMENFLSEEIVLTGGYGEKKFVGSIEDLIKKRFDEILLRPVDSNGETVTGCTADGNTWIEWQLKNNFSTNIKRAIETAYNRIESQIKQCVENALIEMKDNAIKKQVDDAFVKILQK